MKKIVITILIVLLFNCFIVVGLVQAETVIHEKVFLDDYIAVFYNRYSQHFDDHGWQYQAPWYGIKEFKTAETPREIMSIAAYYKYKAFKGDRYSRQVIADSILRSSYILDLRPDYSQSFEDAWAQMAMVLLLDQIPLILEAREVKDVHDGIGRRMEAGISAPDTSNRAALSAVYWQVIVNNFFKKGVIGLEKKRQIDDLILKKINQVAIEDVTSDGWYEEGSPKAFNPHYHIVTAAAFLVYGHIKVNYDFIKLAQKMTDNIRMVSFKNGMVEARIGARPIGLGAQFYLGAGVLNWYFGYDDFSVYLSYAKGEELGDLKNRDNAKQRFFSDINHPDRLEYHSTIRNSVPVYHDDIAFSNLAELFLAIPRMNKLKFSYKFELSDIEQEYNGDDYKTKNEGDKIIFNGREFYQTDSGDYCYYRYSNYQSQKKWGLVLGASIGPVERTEDELRLELESVLGQKTYFSEEVWEILVKAYVENGYTIEEIVDTIRYGPGAVHPEIPAGLWRQTKNYKDYLGRY